MVNAEVLHRNASMFKDTKGRNKEIKWNYKTTIRKSGKEINESDRWDG